MNACISRLDNSHEIRHYKSTSNTHTPSRILTPSRAAVALTYRSATEIRECGLDSDGPSRIPGTSTWIRKWRTTSRGHRKLFSTMLQRWRAQGTRPRSRRDLGAAHEIVEPSSTSTGCHADRAACTAHSFATSGYARPLARSRWNIARCASPKPVSQF